MTDGVCSGSDEGHDSLLAIYRNRYSEQIDAADSELLAVSDVLSEAPGDDAPLPPPPAPIAAPISEPSGVDLSRPIIARQTNPMMATVHETTGPRDAHEPDAHDDPQAPVLRRRNAPKKKVVELGSPVGRPRGGSGSAVSPKSSPVAPRKVPPPPPPGGRKPPPPPKHEEIEELSRVEVIDDLPAYLRDDED